MYITRFVKIKTEFLDKDPIITVLTTAEGQQMETDLNIFCLENDFELFKLIDLPAPLDGHTMLQVGIFIDTAWVDGL